MRRLVCFAALLLVLLPPPLPAQEAEEPPGPARPPPSRAERWCPEGRSALEIPEDLWARAMEAIGFADRPFGFTAGEMEHYGADRFVLPAVRRLFRDAREVPRFTGRAGDALLARAAKPGEAAWYAFRLMDVSAARGVSAPRGDDWGFPGIAKGAAVDEAFATALEPDEGVLESWRRLPEPVRRLVLRVVLATLEARELLAPAFDRDLYDRAAGPAATAAELFAFGSAPFADGEVGRANLEALERFEPSWVALAAVSLLRRLDAAVAEWEEAAPPDLAGMTSFGFDTPAGRVGVFGPGDDEIAGDWAVVVDLGGDDAWSGALGAPGGLDRPVGVLLDLGGDDRYDAGGAVAALGCGNHGIGVLYDLSGDDRYEAGDGALGAACFGAGVLFDRSGDDVYGGGTGVQGSARAGLGLLLDLGGNDRYVCSGEGQGFGGTRGVGALVDLAGNDSYVARLDGNVSETFRGHSVSFAQGAGFGRRADFGDGASLAGGIGLVVDGAGDDSWLGGVYCQGAGYWWSLGALEDRGGNDTYSSIQYSLGSAPHMAIGCCVDLAGDDAYCLDTADLYMQSLACARDGSIAVFLDGSGDDRYRVGNRAAGSGEINALGLFWDRTGDDSYLAERGTPSPGTPPLGSVGYERMDPGSFRERIPCAGVFLDTGGRDTFAESRPPDSAAPPLLAADDAEWQHVSRGNQRSVGIDADLYLAPAVPALEAKDLLVHRFEIVCNTYLVTCRKTGEFAVVDPSLGILGRVKGWEAEGHRLRGVWLTHEHGDHLSGIAEILAERDVPVTAHRAAAPGIAAAREGWGDWGFPAGSAPPDPDVLTADGSSLRLGALRFDLLSAPGHSPGSQLYLLPDRALFAGDVLFRDSVGRTDLPGSDPEALARSLSERCWDLPGGIVVFPGHMEPTTIGEERERNWLFTDLVRSARGEPPIPRPWMGARFAAAPGGPGLLVEEVVPGSPAEASDLRTGDVVLALDGREISGLEDLLMVIRAHAPGDAVPMLVLRAGARTEATFTFGRRPEPR